MRETILSLVHAITPYDAVEAAHLADASAWIRRGSPLFRVTKNPDRPCKHLCSYIVPIDPGAGALLLFDHRKAQLLLPAGGHVEQDEDPRATARRECVEELGIDATFVDPAPFFLSRTHAVGNGAGIDMSFWFLLQGDSSKDLPFDREELSAAHWVSARDFAARPSSTTDPNMHRFVAKLLASGHLNE